MGRETVPGSESLKYVEKELGNLRHLRADLAGKVRKMNGKGVFTVSTVRNDDKERFVKWNNGSYKMETVVSVLKIC